ncbi:hypothetical protein MM0346_05410 [Helicobacter pylori]
MHHNIHRWLMVSTNLLAKMDLDVKKSTSSNKWLIALFLTWSALQMRLRILVITMLSNEL